ncbi:MAG: hypothetical protein V3S48_04265 [Candidatus Neomarinimicrobiota bacterium]
MNKKEKLVNKKHRKNIDRIRKIRLQANAVIQKAKKKKTAEEVPKKTAIKADKKTAVKKPVIKKPAAKKTGPAKKPAKKVK